MKPRLRALALGLGLGAVLSAGIALGQQPPPPPALQRAPVPGQPQPGQIQRIDPKDLPPAFRQPGGPFGPGGALGRPPGAPGGPGGALGRPPGAPGGPGGPGGRLPPGKKPPVRRAAPPPEPEESGHAEEEFCPGHGPTDPPPPPNWWRGILMVNNELAESSNPVYQLLFRYDDKSDPCNPKNVPPPFLATVLNFSVLALLLYRFGRKPLAEALVKRKEGIVTELDNAAKLLADAEERLRLITDKLERLGETREEMRVDSATQAEQEKKHLLAEAEEGRIRLRRDAEFRVEQESKGARADLLQEAVASAVIAAEELLAAKVGSSDLDRLAEDYLIAVGAALGAGKPASAQAEGARS